MSPAGLAEGAHLLDDAGLCAARRWALREEPATDPVDPPLAIPDDALPEIPPPSSTARFSADLLTPAMGRALRAAARRPGGYVCPIPGLRGAAEEMVIGALRARGLITTEVAPVITVAGRVAAGTELHDDDATRGLPGAGGPGGLPPAPASPSKPVLRFRCEVELDTGSREDIAEAFRLIAAQAWHAAEGVDPCTGPMAADQEAVLRAAAEHITAYERVNAGSLGEAAVEVEAITRVGDEPRRLAAEAWLREYDRIARAGEREGGSAS